MTMAIGGPVDSGEAPARKRSRWPWAVVAMVLLSGVFSGGWALARGNQKPAAVASQTAAPPLSKAPTRATPTSSFDVLPVSLPTSCGAPMTGIVTTIVTKWNQVLTARDGPPLEDVLITGFIEGVNEGIGGSSSTVLGNCIGFSDLTQLADDLSTLDGQLANMEQDPYDMDISAVVADLQNLTAETDSPTPVATTFAS